MRNAVAALPKLGEGGQPSFVFAHILSPHPPFVLAADGSDRLPAGSYSLVDGNHWRRPGGGRSEADYQSRYRGQLQALNRLLLASIRELVASTRRPVAIFLASNHGPGSRLDFDEPLTGDVVERIANLQAYYWPGGHYDSLHSSLTPINGIRALLNAQLGTELPARPDRSFISSWGRPYELIDVTDELDRASLELTTDPTNPAN